MDSPCTNHAYSIKHLFKDCEVGGPKEGDGKEAATKKGGAIGKDGESFLDPKECIMIFGGSDTIWSKRQQKVRYREACAAETVVPS